MLRNLKFLPLLAALALLAAACGSDSASNDSESEEVDASGADSEEPTDETSDENATSAPSVSQFNDFDYSTIDYSGPAAGSALRGDRNNSAFPPPLIDPSAIRSGGPPPDGIPPIDNPVFAPADELDFELADNDPVLSIEIEGDARALPLAIMIWHEIVNTEVGGVPVTISYCPLCNSALTFDRRFGDQILDFGTSGELFQSALVMYDRQTESLWSHFTGRGLVGHYAGAELELFATQTVSFGQWKQAHPDGLVLTTETGANRDYGSNPYNGYDAEGSGPIGAFFQGEVDDTLAPKARIVGIHDDSGSIAVRFEDLIETPVFPVTEGGRNLVVFYEPGLASALDSTVISEGRDVGQSGVFVPVAADGTDLTFSESDGVFLDDQTGSEWSIFGKAVAGSLEGEQLESIAHTDTFWFAWATYRPDTTLVMP